MVFSWMQPADVLNDIDHGGISLGFDVFYLVLSFLFHWIKDDMRQTPRRCSSEVTWRYCQEMSGLPENSTVKLCVYNFFF